MTWKPVKISDLDAKTQQEAQKNMDFWLGKGLLPTQPVSKIFGRDVSTIQSGKARGQYIVDRNRFLVSLIEDAVSKSKIKEKE